MKAKLLIILSLALSIRAYAVTATWNLNPTTSDWNTATNWTPNGVPNSGSSVAIFGVSNQTSVSIQSADAVDHITFNPGASAFTISVGPQFSSKLTLAGAGIINNSGVTQNFATLNEFNQSFGEIDFVGGASAGDGTVFTNEAGPTGGGAKTFFFDTSSAGTASFINQSGGANAGATWFFGDSTAANATFTSQGGGAFSQGGSISFGDNSSAGNGNFTNEGATGVFGSAGTVNFVDNSTAADATMTSRRGANKGIGGQIAFLELSTADHATLTLEGGLDNDVEKGAVQFYDNSTAGDALITLEGALHTGSEGALALFRSSSSAGNSTLIANNGQGRNSGASIQFTDSSIGGTARIELLGPLGAGNLEIDAHGLPGVSVGSIEGSGSVTLGSRNLTVGTNNLSTTFSGTIAGSDGSLSKIGSGTFTLSGSNTYTGTTTLSQGALLAANTSGSATGTGAVAITSGTLGGSGIIAGAVTVGGGTGSNLAPAFGSNKNVTLTLQSSLTLQTGAAYTYTFKTRNTQAKADLVIANGVTISGATIVLKGKTQGTITAGTVLTVISNTSASPISGTFSNLADSAIVSIGGNNFQASYHGGDGNDLTLTVVP